MINTRAFLEENKKYRHFKYPEMSVFTRIFFILYFISFSIFFVYTTKYGELPRSSSTAEEMYDGYVEGHYYLAEGNDYTEVPYNIWLICYILDYNNYGLLIIIFSSYGIDWYKENKEELKKKNGKLV